MAALVVLVGRFVFIATSSLSYDEATYVELAAHPWRSDFYPDAVFARHPPLYFLFMWAWTAIAGTSEVAVRLPSLLASMGGVALTWSALRHLGGDRAATLGAVLLGTSFLTLTYGLQATMYPLGFALAALGLWAHTVRRLPIERAALALLCLTHLFGFVFAAVWLWRRRVRTRADLLTFLPVALWLGFAALAVLVAGNPPGPALGPTWQFLRVFALLYEAFVHDGALFVHALVFLVALLLLNPAILRSAWRARRRWSPWAAAGILLTIGLLPGPGFLRYALLLVPPVMAAGLPDLARSTRYPRAATVALAFSLVAGTAGAVYVSSGVDPKASNDVPGNVDWTAVATTIDGMPSTVVRTPATTSLAYYLVADHGWNVTDNLAGPGQLVLQAREGRSLTLVEFVDPKTLSSAQGEELVVLPDGWDEPGLLDGFAVCANVKGASIVVRGDDCGAMLTQ